MILAKWGKSSVTHAQIPSIKHALNEYWLTETLKFHKQLVCNEIVTTWWVTLSTGELTWSTESQAREQGMPSNETKASVLSHHIQLLQSKRLR